MNLDDIRRAEDILSRAKYDEWGNVIDLNLSPSSTECSAIAAVLKTRGKSYADERRNVIWGFIAKTTYLMKKHDL